MTEQIKENENENKGENKVVNQSTHTIHIHTFWCLHVKSRYDYQVYYLKKHDVLKLNTIFRHIGRDVCDKYKEEHTVRDLECIALYFKQAFLYEIFLQENAYNYKMPIEDLIDMYNRKIHARMTPMPGDIFSHICKEAYNGDYKDLLNMMMLQGPENEPIE